MNLRIRNFMSHALCQQNRYSMGIKKTWKYGLTLIWISHETKLKLKTFMAPYWLPWMAPHWLPWQARGKFFWSEESWLVRSRNLVEEGQIPIFQRRPDCQTSICERSERKKRSRSDLFFREFYTWWQICHGAEMFLSHRTMKPSEQICCMHICMLISSSQNKKKERNGQWKRQREYWGGRSLSSINMRPASLALSTLCHATEK